MVGFPLLLIPLAVYNIIAFLMPSVSFSDVLFKVPMITGETWPVTLADMLLALGIVLLLLEVVKGARPGSKFLMLPRSMGTSMVGRSLQRGRVMSISPTPRIPYVSSQP